MGVGGEGVTVAWALVPVMSHTATLVAFAVILGMGSRVLVLVAAFELEAWGLFGLGRHVRDVVRRVGGDQFDAAC